MNLRFATCPIVVVAVIATLLTACASAGDDPVGPGAGSPSTSGSGGVGAPPSGGTSGSSGGAGGSPGGTSAGGTPGVSGGGSSSAGAAGATASGGSGGTAGGGAAGASGSAGAAGSAGGPSGNAKPSAGCNKAGRPAGGVVTVEGERYLAFPESYDGTKPLPALVGFHGCGSNNRGTNATDTEFMRLTKGTGFETSYVRVVPVSAAAGGCWSYNTDIARVKKMYDDLVASYCVDTSRIFATGHSSGAQFAVQIYTQNHTADAKYLGFKAMAPVAASDYGVMTGPIPVMYIQGKMDQERGNGDGHETVARLRAANSCTEMSTPYTQVMGCQSGQTAVNPGCISYEGCKAPTIWCSHNDPAYGTTMHGVPCFGIKAMFDFFQSLP
jgi:polyhydroxybutyrate depolymerase